MLVSHSTELWIVDRRTDWEFAFQRTAFMDFGNLYANR